MLNRLIIKSIKVENFRAYKKFEQDFSSKPVILITGPNGYGKTTLIDAIEWGLTGDIKRISNSYAERNTTKSEKERSENYLGQVKNKEASSNDKVRVEIVFQYGETEFSVWREQTTDYFGEETKLNFSDNLAEETITIIRSLAELNFYPYYVCDNNKAYDFLRTPRKDVLEVFRDFLQNNDYVDDLMNKIGNLESITKGKFDEFKIQYKNINEVITNLSKEVQEIKNETVTGEYPGLVFYNGENVNPKELTEEMLLKQLNSILSVGCNEAIKQLDGIIQKKSAIEKKGLVKKLKKTYEENKEDILLSIQEKYYDKSILEQYEIYRNNVKRKMDEVEKLIDFDTIKKFVEENYEQITISDETKKKISTLKDLEIQKNQYDKNIQIMQEGNIIIAALSDLVKYREAFVSFKQEGYDFCPLCGSSDKFSKIEEQNQIALEAEIYINQSNDRIIKLKENYLQSIKEYDQLIKIIKNTITGLFVEILKTIEKRISKAKSINFKYIDFFTDIDKLKIKVSENIYDDISKEQLIFENIIKKSIDFHDQKEYLNTLLTYYGYSEVTETDIFEVKNNLVLRQDKSLEYRNFDLNYFQIKLNYLKCLADNRKYLNKVNELNRFVQNSLDIEKKLEFTKNKKDELHEILIGISRKRKEFEIKELEYIGPYIFRVFIKIIKHSNIKNIKLKRDNSQNGGMVLVDDNGLNLMNILSQGQLGVLMLAYFFANAIRNNDRSIFKSYFIDDITASLDDLNILAFLDIMKYIICDNTSVMNQIFFSTCNRDVEKLFIHKLKSMNVDFINLKFESYAKVE